MVDFIIKYWLEVLFTLIMTVMGGLLRYVVVNFRAVRLGMQAILRNDIIELYNKCVSRDPKPYIRLYEITNLEEMYTQYHALGGNGTITQLYGDLMDLPTEKEVIHKHHDEN